MKNSIWVNFVLLDYVRATIEEYITFKVNFKVFRLEKYTNAYNSNTQVCLIWTNFFVISSY
jgi:hypothetical protein